MKTMLSQTALLGALWLPLLSCGDKDDYTVAGNDDCDPVTDTTDDTCSTDEGVICILITATTDAISEMGDDLQTQAEFFILELEDSLTNSGLDCAADAQYDMVIVQPDRIFESGSTEELSDEFLTEDRDEDENAYKEGLEKLGSNTLLEEIQETTDADIVIVMVGQTFKDLTEQEDGSYNTGRAADITLGQASEDNPYRKWALYLWSEDTHGPHEFGHLMGARHHPETDDLTSCAEHDSDSTDDAFPFNCGFSDEVDKIASLMSYYDTCGGYCDDIVYMYSNPDKAPPSGYGYSDPLGSSSANNACVVARMWDYLSLTSDVIDELVTEADIEINTDDYYDVTNCPALN